MHLDITAEGKGVIVPTNGEAVHFPMGGEINLTFGGNVAHVFTRTAKTWSFESCKQSNR